MKDIENLDLKLKLLSNSPILVHGINVYPVSIKQIAEFGYTKYNQGLKILCISKIEIENLVNEDISPFEFLQMNMLFDSNIKILLCDVLSLICRAKVTYSSKQEANAYALSLLQQHKRELEEGMANEMERPF